MNVRRGAVVRFHHLDAIEQPKPNRPGIVDTVKWGLLSVFYGSTFKQGGMPRDAEVADPLADVGTTERQLAERLGRAISERTYFHGSMLSETDTSAPTTEVIRGASCPIDVLDKLEEQAENRLIAFEQAWRRTQGWLLPTVRARVLRALWWQVDLKPRERLALSLLVCDGWTLREISLLCKPDPRLAIERSLCLLPHTARLLEVWDVEVNTALGYEDIARDLEPVWRKLVESLDDSVQKVCPKWERIVERNSG